jgi:hypothetical protein
VYLGVACVARQRGGIAFLCGRNGVVLASYKASLSADTGCLALHGSRVSCLDHS